MQEIRTNILEHYEKFQLIVLANSLYQKKVLGEIVVPKDGIVREFVNKWPDIPKCFGSSVGKYGGCPSIAYTIKESRFPTKILTFPVTPTSLRVENPEEIVVARFAKRFKHFSLLCGWMLRPRLDMIEYSSIKLAEIVKFYKLTSVAFPVESMGLGEGDEKYYDAVRDIFLKYFGNLPITLCYSLKVESKGEAVKENTQTIVGSSYKEEEEENL
jgi:hypothetical protein